MSNLTQSAVTKTTLPLSGTRAYLFQLAFITLTVAVPPIFHTLGAPVRFLVPMHWIVIFAGLTYGWKGGLITGFLSPVVSHLLSGYPLMGILPSMTFELAAYGFVAGWLFENKNLSSWLSVSISLIVGRIIFILSIFILSIEASHQGEYLFAALMPGIIAAIGQIILLPLAAKWWVKKEQKI